MKIITKAFIILSLTLTNIHAFDLNISTDGLEPHYKVAHEGPIFPCDLEETTLPEIQIMGENHLSKIAKTIFQGLQQGANAGNFYLGLEGTIYGEEYTDYKINNPHFNEASMKKHIFGLEDNQLYHIISIARSYNDMIFLKGENQKSGEISILLDLATNKFAKKAFKQISMQELLNEYGEDFAVSVTLFASANNLDEFIQHYQALLNTTFASIPNKTYVKFTQRLGLELTNILKKIHPDYDTTNIVNFFNDPQKEEHMNNFALQDCVLVRNQYFIKNLGTEYCKRLKDGKKFILRVGSLHLKDLEKQIKTHSQNKIKVTIVDISKY